MKTMFRIFCFVILCTQLCAATQAASTLPRENISVVLAPLREAVLSAEVTAKLHHRSKEFGQSFKKGEQILEQDKTVFRINLTKAEARARTAQAELTAEEDNVKNKTRENKAKAALNLAYTEYKTAQNLYRDNSMSSLELEKARKQVEVAKADYELAVISARTSLEKARSELETARANVELAQTELKSCAVIAPFDGRVVEFKANESELVQKGQALVKVVDDSVLQARFLLPSSFFRKVKEGQKITLEIRETSQTVNGTISGISAVMDPASGTFEVRANVDNAKGNLRSGMSAELNPAILGK